MKTIQYKKQKKLFLAFLLLLFSSGYTLYAQNVCISASGVAPQASAMLEVLATDKGLLIPRVALTQTTVAAPVSSPASWLIVFNTNTSLDVTPGVYYWDPTPTAKWVRMGKVYTCSNGLTLVGDDFRLGGTLIQATTITQGNFNMTFNINGTGNFDVQHDGTSKLYVKDGGNVGINNTSPGAQLDVIGPSTGSGITIKAGGGGDVVLASGGSLFFDNNYSYAAGNYIRPMAANTQAFFTSGAERMRITSTGNVGIATTTPSSLFSVGASSQFQVNSSGDMIKIKDVTYSWPTSYTPSLSSSLKNDGAGNLSWGPVGWTRICDVVLSDATSYNLTGLDGNVDIAYKIIMMGYHDNPAPAALRYCWISVNGDVAAANYSYGMDCYWMYRGGYGWAYDAYTIGGIFIWVTDANSNPNYCESETILSGFTGDKRHAVTRYSLGLSGKDIVANLSVGLWTNTATNLTSLLFQWTGTSGVNGFHGRLIVYALR